ncbi:hypothetical protein JOM56_012189, partial [Amanita muscaria]
CGKVDRFYKCIDCSDSCLLRCKNCMVDRHRTHPLHRTEEWNGLFFLKVSLQSLGLRIQLSHGGEQCLHPTSAPQGFCIFDVSGVHFVTVDFCNCVSNGYMPTRTQILRAGWFPATFNCPKTAFTFTCLDFFHELMLQGKTTVYDFYHTVLRRTDNLGLDCKIDRYAEFHRVVRIWHGLLMLKCAGRGQDPAGAAATTEGEVAIECPACPQPGRNLPDGWDIPSPRSWLNTQFLSVDGNFKEKQKNRGIKDPELAPGWSYFVKEEPYQEFIKDYI